MDLQMKKQVIKWQFADEFLKQINQKIERINQYILMDDFRDAFEELRQIFTMINNEIQKKKKDDFLSLQEQIKVLSEKIRDYELYMLNDRINRRRLYHISKLKYEIKEKVYEFYLNIMRLMDQLNMLFPRQKEHTGLEIYEQ